MPVTQQGEISRRWSRANAPAAHRNMFGMASGAIGDALVELVVHILQIGDDRPPAVCLVPRCQVLSSGAETQPASRSPCRPRVQDRAALYPGRMRIDVGCWKAASSCSQYARAISVICAEAQLNRTMDHPASASATRQAARLICVADIPDRHPISWPSYPRRIPVARFLRRRNRTVLARHGRVAGSLAPSSSRKVSSV